MKTKINLLLFIFLIALIAIATSYQLNDFASLKNNEGVLTDMRSLVLLEIRLPRIALAVLTGTSLALAGNAMQGVFQNPLASPGLLGSSAGATLVSVFILYYLSVPFIWLLLGGMAGALSSFLLVWLITKNHGTTMMIFSGVAVNVLLGSTVTLLLSNAESPWALAELYRWLQGSLVWARLDSVLMSLPFLALGVICLYFTRRYLDVLTFGEETASTMGVNLPRSFFLLSLGVALLLGATIPQTGTIGFIGLIAPHLARLWMKKPPSQLYLPSALIGALIMLTADLAVQFVPFFANIYIGTLTSLLGAPFLIWILVTQQRQITG
ncbi:branched-chain alpha-keto acid dehydrogenase subunit E2 [Mannheimia granulomatis]|uniref:Branched-chain alpha-keto acid dehydrogenase subunit E2 n=1 Tax=Mannheimia granulomatis TaxID=85402 RepID=A0A6G8JFV5_9PAST|nr:iron ABC transporter permease [Mannheimia granulomatis]QIM66011.1 branched-chain alpha-keto acid dehydrogenase subunit E2 [Mannheimia granulomatis]